MKTIFKVFAAAISLILISAQCEPDPIDPNEPVNIPDQAFLDALIEEGVDINGDNIISYGEAEAINFLNLGYGTISDMTGIEAFIELDTLVCEHNPISFLNVSKNSNLIFLNCHSCELQSLNVSGNSKLIELYVGNCCYNCRNNLTELDLSKCKNLEILSVWRNSLSSLDLSNNTALNYLVCAENVLTKLDLSNNSYLIYLDCRNCEITELNLSNNRELTSLYASGNLLTTLDISNNSNLRSIYLENMPSLFHVCVWTQQFPPPDTRLYYDGSPNAIFAMGCSK